jgi:fructose/tagatose bisphosphate aldolase
VQLDHTSDLGLIRMAFELGASAVMADGSRLDDEANCEFVASAVAIARAYDGLVEAELGGIHGDEDVAQAVAAGALTEPDQAADFLRRTGADCLAVSIGNVHGLYREPPRLDWDRLAGIRRVVGDRSLSLHGASGLDSATIRAAIEHGIAKINVNTELREAYFGATTTQLAVVSDGLRLLELHEAQRVAVARVVSDKLCGFRGP